MFSRFFSILILIGTCYILGVFFLPKETDEVAKKFWIERVNEVLRSLKSESQKSDTPLELNMSGTIWNNINTLVNQVREATENGKSITQTKLDQAKQVIETGKRVIESVQKTSEAVWELKNSVSTLTSTSGSTSSWVGTITASGNIVNTSK